LPPHTYDQETQYIADAIRLCTAITPELARKIFDHPDLDPRFVTVRDPAYTKCDASQTQFVTGLAGGGSGHSGGRHLDMNLKVVGHNWLDARGLDVYLYFHLMTGEDVHVDRGIVSGAIDMASTNPGSMLAFAVASSPTAPTQTSSVPMAPGQMNPPAVNSDSSVNVGNARTIVLTHQSPSAEGSATIIAPGRGRTEYSLVTIDTRDFPQGGTLEVEVAVDAASATNGAFDLFPAGARITANGRATSIIGGLYDIPKGLKQLFSCRFMSGTVFGLGLKGDYRSPQGAKGNVTFKLSIR
jgi:hypothetical protein